MRTIDQMIESFESYQANFQKIADMNLAKMKQSKLAHAEMVFTQWVHEQVLAQIKVLRILQAIQHKELLPEDLQKKESALFIAFAR